MSVKFSTKELQRIIAQPGYGIVNGELPDNAPSGRNKFNAVSVVFNGIRFDSKAEMARYGSLRLLELTNQISDLELQPVFELPGKVRYRADFKYVENGKTIVEDVKGFETASWKIKKKLFLETYPDLELRITKA